MNKIYYAFFGSSEFSIQVLNRMMEKGFLPNLIVTTPDKPKGRGLRLTPNPVKTWAIKNKIPFLDPKKLDSNFLETLKRAKFLIYIVASYGKIIPKAVLDLPTMGSLNVHPSLLPKYRGASPLQSTMLDDCKDTGITIMQIDEHMDHGPIVAQKKIHIAEWPNYINFENMMAREGADLLTEILPNWIAGKIIPKEQNQAEATYTRKITKEDGLINIPDDLDLSKIPLEKQYSYFRKIQAFQVWPQAYFIVKKEKEEIRVKITQARFENNHLVIEKVIPAGSKNMTFEDFKRGHKKPKST